MGVLVQVKSSVAEVNLPPLNLLYVAGATTTLTDREYGSLIASVKAAVIVLRTGLADPVRSTITTSPSTATDAYRLSKQYTDEAVRGLASLGTTPPAQMATHTEVATSLTTAKSYADTAAAAAAATERNARITGDATFLSSANTYTDQQVVDLVHHNELNNVATNASTDATNKSTAAQNAAVVAAKAAADQTYIPVGPQAPDPTKMILWADTGGTVPVLRAWSVATSTWVALGVSGNASGFNISDNGDGTAFVSAIGTSTLVDNGDGTYTADGPGTVDNGDGTFILGAVA